MYKFLNSERLLQSAKSCIPLGSQTFSKSITQLPLGVSPYFVKSAKGSNLIDVDGNKYIDFVAALAAVNIGYLDDDITKAVIEQVQKGSIFSLSSELEIKLAQKLIEIIPCITAPIIVLKNSIIDFTMVGNIKGIIEEIIFFKGVGITST